MRKLVLYGVILVMLALISVALAPNSGDLKAQVIGERSQASPDITVNACSAINIAYTNGGISKYWDTNRQTWVYFFSDLIDWDCSIGNYQACEIFINIDYWKSTGANGPWTALSSSCLPLPIYSCGTYGNLDSVRITFPATGRLAPMTYYKVARSMAVATPDTVGGSCSANNVLYGPPYATDVILVPPNQ